MSNIKINKLKIHPTNPRIIKDSSFEKLCQSLKDFPEMMAKREIIIDSWENPVILCGNQRFKALKEIGYKEIPDNWIKTAEDLTEDQKKELMIKDNVQHGDWDFDMLSEWDIDNLNDWGLEIDKKEIKKSVKLNLQPFKTSHILISFNPNELIKLQAYIEDIKSKCDVDIEISSN